MKIEIHIRRADFRPLGPDEDNPLPITIEEEAAYQAFNIEHAGHTCWRMEVVVLSDNPVHKTFESPMFDPRDEAASEKAFMNAFHFLAGSFGVVHQLYIKETQP